MMDIWRTPFGFEYLAFGNLHLAIGISVGAPLPSFGRYLGMIRRRVPFSVLLTHIKILEASID